LTFTDQLTGVQNSVTTNQKELERYIRFDKGWIELGEEGSPFMANFTNVELSFSQNGQIIASFSNNRLYILKAEFREGITSGDADKGYYDQIVRGNKHWALKYRVGGDE
jgi:hypothetical protein